MGLGVRVGVRVGVGVRGRVSVQRAAACPASCMRVVGLGVG